MKTEDKYVINVTGTSATISNSLSFSRVIIWLRYTSDFYWISYGASDASFVISIFGCNIVNFSIFYSFVGATNRLKTSPYDIEIEKCLNLFLFFPVFSPKSHLFLFCVFSFCLHLQVHSFEGETIQVRRVRQRFLSVTHIGRSQDSAFGRVAAQMSRMQSQF